MIKTVIMGTGRMGSLIRTTAEGVVDAAGQPVFDIVAQIGFDLSELESAPAADVIIDFSNVVTFDAVVAYVERTGAALVSGTTGYTPELRRSGGGVCIEWHGFRRGRHGYRSILFPGQGLGHGRLLI